MLIVKEDIISRINNGDAKAFEQLYTTFYVYLCAVVTKYVYNPEAAREIVNDVFMNVWNHHSALIHPVNAYLIRSVRNYCLNYLEINASKKSLYQMYKKTYCRYKSCR